MSTLEVRGLRVALGRGDVLHGVDLTAEEGELVTLVGPSGAGKSTLLRAIAGLAQPSAGTIAIDGRDVTRDAPPDRGVAMVFQSFALFPHMTARQNIEFGLEARGLPAAERAARVEEAAERLDISALLARRPGELSGGERQRVALARGLASRPRLLLLDEPLSNVDAPLRARARAVLRRLQADAGVTALHVTHDQAEALALGDRVVVLAAGRVLQQGPPDAVYERPAHASVAAFLGSPPMALLPARVEGGEAVAGPLRVVLPRSLDEGRPLLIGLRAEDVSPGAPGGFEAVVELAERAGHDRVWQLEADGLRFAARPPADCADVRPGDRVRIAVAPGRARLFDASSGEAL